MNNNSRVIVLLCITVCTFVIFQQQLPETKDVIYGSITLTGEISMNNDLNSKESKKTMIHPFRERYMAKLAGGCI